jgi:hypothetical protein
LRVDQIAAGLGEHAWSRYSAGYLALVTTMITRVIETGLSGHPVHQDNLDDRGRAHCATPLRRARGL